MESIEATAMQIKATFEDIEQRNINKILYCEQCSLEDKKEELLFIKEQLLELVEEVNHGLKMSKFTDFLND